MYLVMVLMNCSTGRACLGVVLVDRFSGQQHYLEETFCGKHSNSTTSSVGTVMEWMNTCVFTCSYCSGHSGPSVWAMEQQCRMPVIIDHMKSLDKENGNTQWVPIYCDFYLLANTGITIDRGSNYEILACLLLWISHHMRSRVTKLPVLAILASTVSIPRNTDEY